MKSSNSVDLRATFYQNYFVATLIPNHIEPDARLIKKELKLRVSTYNFEHPIIANSFELQVPSYGLNLGVMFKVKDGHEDFYLYSILFTIDVFKTSSPENTTLEIGEVGILREEVVYQSSRNMLKIDSRKDLIPLHTFNKETCVEDSIHLKYVASKSSKSLEGAVFMPTRLYISTIKYLMNNFSYSPSALREEKMYLLNSILFKDFSLEELLKNDLVFSRYADLSNSTIQVQTL